MSCELYELKKTAHYLTKARRAESISKLQARKAGLNLIHSILTEQLYSQIIYLFLIWRASIGMSRKGDITNEEMQEYLYDCESLYEQKQLDSIRQALNCVFGVELLKAASERTTDLVPRAYTPAEVSEIINYQGVNHGFSSRVCLSGGIRAHELATIRRADELHASTDRPWRSDLFANFGEYVRYTVTGKGGLNRHFALPTLLAIELEARRLTTPKLDRDRKVNYTLLYDVGFGQEFSQSFSRASVKALGFSHGAHGLRHSYAQARFLALRDGGYGVADKLLILSQELGHFRKDICLAYLR